MSMYSLVAKKLIPLYEFLYEFLQRKLQMADKSDGTLLRMALGNKRHMKFEDPPTATPRIEDLN